MPGFDRTGPSGAGPMSGGGKGRCYPFNKRGSFQKEWKRGRGRAGGFGNRYMGEFEAGFPADDSYNWYRVPPGDKTGEVDMLKAETVSMKNAIETIEKRIRELEKSARVS